MPRARNYTHPLSRLEEIDLQIRIVQLIREAAQNYI